MTTANTQLIATCITTYLLEYYLITYLAVGNNQSMHAVMNLHSYKNNVHGASIVYSYSYAVQQ